MLKNKSGVSAVVATVLLIALTVAAISLIGFLIIPMVRENLSKGTSCFEIIGKLEIDENSGYTCYNSALGEASISIKFGDIDVGGVAVSVVGEGNSKTFKLYNGTVYEDVKMRNQEYNQALSLPGKGEERTYVFNVTSLGSAGRAEIAAITKAEMCQPTESVKLQNC